MKRAGPQERLQRTQDASPQTANGHTQVSNELLEEVYRFPFTAPQLRLLLFVLRDSYGWKRKETQPYSNTQLGEHLSMIRSVAGRAVRDLDKLGVIQRLANGAMAPIKNYNAWGGTPMLPLEHADSLVRQLTGASKSDSLVRQNRLTGASKRSTSESLYGERKVKKERKDETTQLLPNGKNDTPTARAELGHPEHAPQDHPDFRRLSFKIQDRLSERWETRVEEHRKATACRKCQLRPRASESWAYCRPCTTCARCGRAPGGGHIFHARRGEIVCSECKEDA